MALHQVALICSCVLVVLLAVIQVIMRRQAHDAKYGIGNHEVSPVEVRYSNDMCAIWKAHKEVFERSALRSVFIVLFVAWLVFTLVAALSFLAKS
jgi:hypothetical protein